MSKRIPKLWICALILALTLIWRMIGSPLNAEQFEGVRTNFWQASILLPQRTSRIISNWIFVEKLTSYLKEDSSEATFLSVFLCDTEQLVDMSMSDYVCGVVSEEMPAAYHIEALKAQAVAARTRAFWQKENGGCSNHPGADICTDSAHCQGYLSPAECKTKWSTAYDKYNQRIAIAESATRKQILMYNNSPIQVFYHAISGGKTEDAQAVFSQSMPYLVSVESRGEETVLGFRSEMLVPFEEAAKRLSVLTGKTITAQEIKQTLTISSYTKTGRVHTVNVAGNEINALAFRNALELRSTWFSITMNEEGISFHQQGYGHGVGMSQAGANVMASQGMNYQDILLHYYPGTLLANE